ncbi:unnamed protein product [Rotaria sp. Silwood1]|nr:unnamed protein product [Rotaria sp. Silwood1]CAF1535681.1 unnamed protein product [Rotaria sp. Silwood1]CAF3734926.1 unnamed protein product [Rotaria sp. Silwood1]
MCKVTPFDSRCIASCLTVCLAIDYLLQTVTDDNIEMLIDRVQKETLYILGGQLKELNLDELRSIGYTCKCLASGFYGLRSTKPFQTTVNDLIRYSGDADTNGAVCGAMYSARRDFTTSP